MQKYYKEESEFIAAINELNSEKLRYEYISGGDDYVLDEYHNTFRLPTNNKNEIVGVSWRDVTKRIVLPEVMPTIGLSYYGTFDHAIITPDYFDSKLIFGQVEISVFWLFSRATFVDCASRLTVQDSWLKVFGMFWGTKGLHTVTFDNCKLGDMNYLFTNSDVENVIFRKCSLLDCDKHYDYKDIGACKVFATNMKTLTLKNCDCEFVNTIVGMFNGVTDFKDLEINIVD